MSWLSDIAGKAENFLNAMDKSAASVVSSATEVVANSGLGATLTGSSPGHSAPSSRRHSRKHSMRSDLGDLDRRSTTTSTAFDTEFIETPDIMSLKTSTSTNSLYSSNGNGNGNGNGGGSTSATKNGGHHHHHQRNSSFGSVGSNGNGKGFTSRDNDTTNFDAEDDHLMEFLNSKEPANIPEEDQGGWAHQNSDHHLEPSPSFVVGGDDTASSHSATEDGASHSDGHSNSSAPQNQDHLQQVKIDALSKELSGLQKRYSDLLSEYKSMQKRAVAFHNQNVGSEKALREARSRESDLLAALQAKDSQIAALKVSLEALEAEAQRRTSTLQSLETAHQALQQELEESRSLQSQPQPQEPSVDPEVLAALQAEVLSLKTTLAEERDQSQRLVEAHRETLGRLEDTQRSLVEQLEAARREAAEARRASAEAELASGPALQRAASLEAELAEFRLKASRTLADKEETIRRLQEISGGKEEAEVQQSGEFHHTTAAHLLQEQVNALNLELADLQAKFTATRAALDRAEGEALPRAQYEIQSLQEALQREQATVGRLQADVHQLSGQAATAAEEAASLRASLSARIAERDEEIEKLRRQLVARQKTTTSMVQSASSSSAVEIAAAASSEEWEQRLRTLTESLIAKQATVEQLSSANHSLKLQLERAEQRLREMAASSGTAALNNDVAIGIYHSPTFTNYIKHRMTGSSGMGDNHSMSSSSASSLLMEEGPNDGQVTRKVKRAYGAIDAFSIRLGNFLRVYPSARAAFLVYILVLHLWVAFVLLYYEPEVHGPDFHHGGGGGGENSANNPSNPLDLVPKGA
ncbi:Golgin sub A member 5 [Tyrophagus putrescentiae]|nr:Golgin sub A member 5 [Tyrophagus putrescentiae]